MLHSHVMSWLVLSNDLIHCGICHGYMSDLSLSLSLSLFSHDAWCVVSEMRDQSLRWMDCRAGEPA